MKKQTLVATIGTLALLANILLPGLAFGQAGQTARTSITCDPTSPSYVFTPAAVAELSSDGVGGTVYSRLAAQNVFNQGAGINLTATDAADYVSVTDPRDPSAPLCNDGLTVTMAPIDTDEDGCFFETAPTVDGDTDLDGICDEGEDNFIPLDQFYYITSSDTCMAGGTENNTTGLCFASGTLCGEGDGTPATACTEATDGSTSGGADYTGTAFATIATFTSSATGSLGSAENTAAIRTILDFDDGDELYGTAGTGIAYAATTTANQETGVYQLPILITLSER